jgi:hypothetical protein
MLAALAILFVIFLFAGHRDASCERVANAIEHQNYIAWRQARGDKPWHPEDNPNGY